MKKKELLKMVNDLDETHSKSDSPKQEKILLVDALNLFFRNFAMLNMVNPEGIHVGGLGGFFRSLGALIRQSQPDKVYVVFDGAGSSNNRKNLIPEYKSGRNIQRITNWEVFENFEEEDSAKIDQIVRIIQYLKTLPVRVVSIDKVEADDIIAYLSKTLSGKNSKCYIVSSDKDFIQLINPNVMVYRPIEKIIYTEEKVREKFGLPPENFILYKTLMGDSSDKIKGVKGLGQKKLKKLFPELSESKMELDEIFSLCEKKYDKNVIYSRIIQHKENLKKSYKVMDLSKPMLDEKDKEFIFSKVKEEINFYPEEFLGLYHKDKLGGIIRNVDFWVKDVFKNLK